MIGWYEKAFGDDYLSIYEHRDIDEARRDIRDIIRLIKAEKDDRILDLCCGSGRHLRALYEEGYRHLYGFDLSPQLLKNARRRNGQNIKYIQGDMRVLPFKDKFDFIMSLFTSFGYFENDRENKNVLKGVYNTLTHGGTFILDYMNKIYIENNLVEKDILYKNHMKIDIKRWISNDGKRVEKEMVINPGNKIYNESVRLFSMEELLSMFLEQGFININYFGSLSGDNYDNSSQRIIITGEKQ